MFMLTNKLLILSPPLSGSKKKTKIWNYQLSNLGFCQSVSTLVTAIFKNSLGIHSTLMSLLQVTRKRIKDKKKSLQCEEEKTTLGSVLC